MTHDEQMGQTKQNELSAMEDKNWAASPAGQKHANLLPKKALEKQCNAEDSSN